MKTVKLMAACMSLAALAIDAHADEQLRRDAATMFGRIEAPSTASTPEIELGRALFWDTRVSANGKVACASCHPAADWGADRRRFSTDARGELTPRQSPTVFNSVAQPALRWLGDRKSLAEQAEGSLTGSMGFPSKDAGIARVSELQYEAQFKAAYPQDDKPVSATNYGRAIAAYEATLWTPSAFDRFVGGDDSALDARQQAGLRAFIATGCSGCHNGNLLGGRTFQKFGVVKDYWLETGSEKHDAGRESATKKAEDRYVFRVAMLRNIAKTAPYFHDGSVDKLDRAVRVMAAVQLGKTLDDATVESIVAFLESLSGEVPSNYAPPGQRPSM
ncbi:MAG TPA: cytochrome c peroxidase [Casimicrobiaceae bacterium]|nr:cytochrome c peroxidase [Casimicrobiaceae bacterium]